MSTSPFGYQNETLVLTPAGYIDSNYLNGADGSNIVCTWNPGNGNSITTQVNALSVGTRLSLDLTNYFNDPGTPNASMGFHRVSGDDPVGSGFAVSNSVPHTLTNNCTQAFNGTFQIVSVRSGVSVLSDPISFAITAPVAGVDNIAPTTPTSVTTAQGTAVGTFTVTFDAPVDIAPANATASGSAHVDILVNNAVVAPSPVLLAANALAPPTGVNIGNITNPSVPAYIQTNKVWQLSTAGTGLVGATSEQIFMLDFGIYSNSLQVVGLADAYTGGTATGALAGIIIHETAVAGGRLVAVAIGPQDGTTGIYVITRATASAAATVAFSVLKDANGHAITGPVYLKAVRAADNKTFTISYSLSAIGSTAIGTVSVAMNAAVHCGIFATSASAGNAIVASVEEVAITTTTQSYTATVSSTVSEAFQLRAVDADNNVSNLSPALTGVPKPPVTPPPSGKVRIHPGHRFWLYNPYYPGNQQGEIAGAVSTICANSFNGIAILMTWADISDAALTAGKQTFGIFQTNLQDALTRIKNAQAASSNPSKKVYVTIKWWQGTFYPSYSSVITAVSGNVITVSGMPSSGLTVAGISGHGDYSVTSNTATSITLSGSPGSGAVGATVYAGKASANDGSLWPSWLIAKGNWVQTFVQPNGNARGQLAYDNASVWAATLEMFQGMANVINSLDTDLRIDIIAVGDESTCATVAIGGTAVCNGVNYDTQFISLMEGVAAAFPTRTTWCTMNYSADSNDVNGCQTIFSTLMKYWNGYGWGGPDSPCFGVHGNVNSWYTTFLNDITGLTGTLGDVRDTCLRIGNTEGPGMLGAGSNYASKPALTLQQSFNDAMTRQAVPVNGSIGAHAGLGCSVMHWCYQNSFYYKTADIVTTVNANNGYYTPLPTGNWDTTP